MNDLKHTEQQTHSPETLAELNPQQLLQRIQAAETAIFCRLQGMKCLISSLEHEALPLAASGGWSTYE